MVDLSARQLLKEVHSLDIKLWVEDGKLRSKAPKGAITPALRSQIQARKEALIALLSQAQQARQTNLASIQPAARSGPIPLSFVQESLWLLEQIEPDNSAYNEVGAVQLAGTLDIAILRQALAEVIRRHEILRTTFALTPDGIPCQVINAFALDMPVSDLSHLTRPQQIKEIQSRARQEGQTRFDLAQGPLFRVRLYRLRTSSSDNSATAHVLLIAMHHLISDVWSMGLLIQEVAMLYTALVAGKPSPLPALPIQYADYAIWQRAQLQGRAMDDHLNYWKEHLAGAPSLLQVPTDHARPLNQTFQGRRVQFAIAAACTAQLRALAQQTEATLFMVLLAAFNVLLARYSRQEDIVIGAPIANRQRREVESLIGFFVNTIVFRTRLAGNPTFLDVLAQVTETTQNAYAHQDVSFAALVSALQPVRDLSYSPLFQVMFAFQNIPTIRNLEMAAFTMDAIDLDLGISKYDLSLELYETEHGLSGVFEFNTDLFTFATIDRMIGHLQTLLQAIVDEPDQSIHALPLLTVSERHQLLVEWNATATSTSANNDSREGMCAHRLFEEQVARSPNAIALIYEPGMVNGVDAANGGCVEQLTYRELNERANQLAHYLQNLGMASEALVGICMERSVEMIVGLLGVLKAGGTYVPLDPAFPQDRLDFLLADIQSEILLTQAKFASRFDETGQKLVCLDRAWPAIAQYAMGNPAVRVNPNTLCYVIYTSGSTGQPKGVMIEHQALAQHALNVGGVYGISAQDHVLQFSAFSFDAAHEQIFYALSHGATLVLRGDNVWTSEEFNRQVSRHGISVVELTPLYFHELIGLWLQDRPSFLDGALRLIQVSSEALQPETLALWQRLEPATRLLNIYGPTEATVTATSFDLTNYQPERWPTNLPIGRPFPGRTAYILDDYLHPVALGLYGELYIGGDGLARGYLNRPDLTAERFIDSPFAPVDRPEKLYKTGDIVRWLPAVTGPPNIEFVGRVDNQIKLRGYRIELGEVEHVLIEHPQVAYAAVLVHEAAMGDKRLVAYVAAKDQHGTGAGWQEAPATLRDYLRQKLPDYMVPSAFVILDHFPLTSSGKIDRNALPAPERSAFATESHFDPPQTPTEELLAGIWAEVLKLEQVGRHDNFFDLGGHSLLLTQLFFRLQTHFQVDLSLRDIFTMPTICELATAIDTKAQGTFLPQMIDLAMEARLDPTIMPTQAVANPPMNRQLASLQASSSILLTGGTGFLGAFLLYELLQQTPAMILCLVRAGDQTTGMSRLQSNLERYGLWTDAFAKRIVPVLGDLAQPLFGLTAAQFHALAAQVDRIYHNGALVNFFQPYESLKAVNVLGTQEVLRLAAGDSPIPVHYVSTLSIFDAIDHFDGRSISEESDLGSGSGLLGGYVQSKWVAEQLVRAAQSRGLPVNVYRPGTISGHSKTGVWNTDDFFCRFLKGCIQLGARPQLEGNFHLAPVDFVSRAIVAISQDAANQNRTFHLESPYPVQSHQLVESLVTFGYPIEEVPADRWLTALKQAAHHSQPNALTPLLPLFETQFAESDQPNMFELYRNAQSPVFDCTNTTAALAHTDIACPPIDEAQLSTYLSYFIYSGFLDRPANRID